MHSKLSQGSQYAPPCNECPAKAGKERQSMSKDTDKNLFIVSSMPRLYQHLLKGLSSYQKLAETILSNIKTAYDFRHIERVRELSGILIHIPIKEYQFIGEYYLIWCECRESRLHTESLERIIGQTQTYKAQALLSRGTFEVYKGNPEAALYFYIEGLKASHSVSDHIGLSLAVAQLKSIEGFHVSSLDDLENLIPIIGHAEPRLYYDFLNSYAVEIDKAGHKNEARNIIRHVLASPFIHAYPAWRETADELRESNRSFIAINRMKRHNILTSPASEQGESEHEIKQTNSIQAPFSLDESDDNLVQFPHLVDVEKLEKESQERFSAEMDRFYALTDNCQLHDFVDDILIGNMNPVRFAKFLLRMSKFEDIKTVLDVFHFMLRYTFLNSDEFKESETEWTERLLKEIESVDTL
jgi:hypothetical protein